MAYFIEKWGTDHKDFDRVLAEESLIQQVTERIWELLEKKEMSKSDLAKSMGKSKAFVSQILSGSRNMTFRTFADIAFALNVKPMVELEEDDCAWVQIGTLRANGFRASNSFVIDGGTDEKWTYPTSVTNLKAA